MESVQNIKRRLRGVQNIGQITKAMGFVAATKMRKSQELAIASRPYTLTALRFLSILSSLKDITLPPLLQTRNIVKTAFVLVSSDKGLAGSFNSAVFREFEQFARRENLDLKSEKNVLIAVGEKTRSYLQRKKIPVEKAFIRVGDYTTPEQTKEIADFLISGYLEEAWDKVIVFSTNFITALNQKVGERQIFPVSIEDLKKSAREIIPERGRFSEMREEMLSFFQNGMPSDYIIEPSPEFVFTALARYLLGMRLYHIILEANASEHAARRVAMKSASDNAEELAGDLALAYNKSRQASITQEITEIAAGVEALQ